jgi:hypothetical protein
MKKDHTTGAIQELKNIFHENPVEVRSFDGMYII